MRERYVHATFALHAMFICVKYNIEKVGDSNARVIHDVYSNARVISQSKKCK